MPRASARRSSPLPKSSSSTIDVVSSSASSEIPDLSLSTSAAAGMKRTYASMHLLHSEELSALWPADPRIPTPASRNAWALARNLNPVNVNAWWYRRKKVAKKLRIKIPRDEYVLDVGIPPIIPEEDDDVRVKTENEEEETEMLELMAEQPYWSIEDGTPSFLKFPLDEEVASPWRNFGQLLSEPIPPSFTHKPDPLDAYMESCEEIEAKRRAYTHLYGPFLPSVNVLAVPPLDSSPEYSSWESFIPKVPAISQDSSIPNTEIDGRDRSSMPPSSPPPTSSSPLLSSPIGLHLNLRSFEDVGDDAKQVPLGSSAFIAGSSRPPSPSTPSSGTSSTLFTSTSLPPSSSSTPDTTFSDDFDLSSSSKILSILPCSPKPSAIAKVNEKVDTYTDPSFGSALTFSSALDPSLCTFSFSDSLATSLEAQDFRTIFSLDRLQFTLDGTLMDGHGSF
ncbi:hypothetical protein BKA70DRAFT_1238434 [Coprinopsis sp. MPI-PUGE-AT-0042]|nr:hypothetical protein BKA70DRAFT_1238434 [Coprinopsis sp. MPI-PUGE-AT-0042]